MTHTYLYVITQRGETITARTSHAVLNKMCDKERISHVLCVCMNFKLRKTRTEEQTCVFLVEVWPFCEVWMVIMVSSFRGYSLILSLIWYPLCPCFNVYSSRTEISVRSLEWFPCFQKSIHRSSGQECYLPAFPDEDSEFVQEPVEAKCPPLTQT